MVCVAVPLLMAWWKRSHGWWISGMTPRSTGWVTGLLVLVLGGALLSSFLIDSLWVSAGLAVATVVVVTVLGGIWMRVWRAGLSQGATSEPAQR